MAYFAAILHMIDADKNKESLPLHMAYLNTLDQAGKIFTRGPFTDGSGGLVIFIASSFEEARSMAEQDPHITYGSRRLELKEWKIVPECRAYI